MGFVEFEDESQDMKQGDGFDFIFCFDLGEIQNDLHDDGGQKEKVVAWERA